MISLTPIEAALWSTGVAIQAGLALKIFGTVLFTGFVVLFFTKHCHKTLASVGDGSDSIALLKSLAGYGFLVLLGLSFLRTVSQESFSPTDGSNRKWSNYAFVNNTAKFAALQNSKDGLYWYLMFQKGATELSSFVTDVITGLFNDPGYSRSPDMLFKILVNTASVTLDDPRITVKLDRLMNQCSDTKKGKIIGEKQSLFMFLDLENPDCMEKYRAVQSNLKDWAKNKTPSYLKRAADQSSGETAAAIKGFSDLEAIENKIIASSLVAYAKDKGGSGRDYLNTNEAALGITDNEDYAWFTLQRSLSGVGAATWVGQWFGDEKGNVEGGIHRNEARIVYNNLYNLIPSFRGYVKIFLAVFFILASAALALGFTKPLMVWFSALIMDAGYLPVSALNYEIHALIMSAGDIGARFADLSSDPMLLMGAAAIDSQLVFYQTTYFLVQFVIAAMLVIGVIYSGFAVNKMSFGHGAAFGGMLGTMGGNRMMGAMGSRAGEKVSDVSSSAISSMASKVRGRSTQ